MFALTWWVRLAPVRSSFPLAPLSAKLTNCNFSEFHCWCSRKNFPLATTRRSATEGAFCSIIFYGPFRIFQQSSIDPNAQWAYGSIVIQILRNIDIIVLDSIFVNLAFLFGTEWMVRFEAGSIKMPLLFCFSLVGPPERDHCF